MKYRLLLVTTLIVISGCVSNKAVQTVQVGDEQKSCVDLKIELAELGVEFEDAKDDSGVTGKNAGLLILFWPGIIVNEVRANKNQDSIDERISHLSAIYDGKCSAGEAQNEVGETTLKENLLELKDLHDEGLINDEEYETSRKRALENQ